MWPMNPFHFGAQGMEIYHFLLRLVLAGVPVVLVMLVGVLLLLGQDTRAFQVRVPADQVEGARLGFRAVDTRIDPDRALVLADGSALYPLGSGAPQVWAWCQTPTAEALDVRGAVLGWYAAHALAEPIQDALTRTMMADPRAARRPAVIAVDGCHDGPTMPWVPWRSAASAEEPLLPASRLYLTGGQPDLTRAIPLSGGRVLVPVGVEQRASAWMLCPQAPTSVPPGGSVVGFVGADHLPDDLQRAIDDAELAGWVDSSPWTPVLAPERCVRGRRAGR
jgi:hypothetical protein